MTGEPGVGKTTLIKVFCDGLRDRADVWVTRGQCIAQYGAGEPYLPVLEASERLAHQMDEPRLIDVLRQHAPTWAAQLPSLLPPSERQALQQELRGATQARMLREMASAFERLTAERALVLCLEDLQWSDHATLALVAALARRPERARLLVLATYRPADALVGSPHLREVVDEIAFHDLGDVLPLAPLSVADLQEYLRRRFGNDPSLATLAAAVHRRTEGNPLFTITVIADLVAQGALQQREGGWDLSSAALAVRGTVPETVRQLIERQANSLDRIEQRLLEAGSVAGAEFSTAAVAAALGELPMELEARCADLVQRGLFLSAREPVSSPDGTTSARFAFRHALYQEILYGRVPPARRAELHGAIGAQLERAHPDAAREIATELATHFDRAGDAARAVRYLEHAGNAALTNRLPSASRSAVTMRFERGSAIAICVARPADASPRRMNSSGERPQAMSLRLPCSSCRAVTSRRERTKCMASSPKRPAVTSPRLSSGDGKITVSFSSGPTTSPMKGCQLDGLALPAFQPRSCLKRSISPLASCLCMCRCGPEDAPELPTNPSFCPRRTRGRLPAGNSVSRGMSTFGASGGDTLSSASATNSAWKGHRLSGTESVFK